MPAREFLIAMANKIHTGRYDPPLRDPSRGGCEWLLVRRWGDKGEYLEISDTTLIRNGKQERGEIVECCVPDIAPSSLKALNSMLGLMVRSEGESGATFLLVRRNIEGQTMSGKFYPVDGYCELKQSGGKWSIKASGRHAHDKEGNDVPNPPEGGMSWHFDAYAVYWEGHAI